MSNFGITRADAAFHRGAEGVVDVHEHGRLRRRADRGEDLLLIDEGVAQDHRRGREIAEHELVALLGDRRGGGDVDDEGDALLLGDLGDGGALAGIEGADQQLRALADQLFGARAGDLDVGFGVGIHDLQRRQAEVLEKAVVISTPRWQSWPMPAWKPERGSSTPTFRAAPCARTMLNGAVPARSPAAPSPR